jgi:hypothetical protein
MELSQQLKALPNSYKANKSVWTTVGHLARVVIQELVVKNAARYQGSLGARAIWLCADAAIKEAIKTGRRLDFDVSILLFSVCR